MNKLELKNFNLEATLMGGQAFNWDFIDGVYYGFMQDKLVFLKPARQSKEIKNVSKLKTGKNFDLTKTGPNTTSDTHLNDYSNISTKYKHSKFKTLDSEFNKFEHTNTIFWQTYPKNNDFGYIYKYLNLGIDFDSILLEISKDQHIRNAMEVIPHIRILNQDFEQTLLSFILSSNKSIKGIRSLVRKLSKLYGQKLEVDGRQFYLFPQTEVLANLSESELRVAGAGFRAKYLKEAAIKLINDRDKFQNPEFFREEESVRSYLLTFKGIGNKIADCIMVFSLGFTTITPLDIWGIRVLTNLYNVDPKLKYSEMRDWYKNFFGRNTSWAGQILFEYYRGVKVKGVVSK